MQGNGVSVPLSTLGGSRRVFEDKSDWYEHVFIPCAFLHPNYLFLAYIFGFIFLCLFFLFLFLFLLCSRLVGGL